MTTRILLADDHEFVRRGVRSLLETHPVFQICGEAKNGLEAVAMAEELRPDVVVLDISMPEMNGLDAAREIRKRTPDSEILILSQHNSAEVMKAALNAGARGYIAKSEVARDLLAAVAAVSEHRLAFGPKLSQDDTTQPASAPVSSSPLDPKPQRASGAADGRDSHELRKLAVKETAPMAGHDGQVSLADSLPVLIWASDAGGNCTFFNKPWLEFTGRTMEDELETRWAQKLHPDDVDACMNDYFSSVQACQPFTTEFHLKRADGQYRWLLSYAVPRFNDAGALQGYVGSCIDISERKHSELALRRSHDDLESLVEQRTISLRRLSARLLQIQDEERRRIARELHDSLGQLLTAAHINLDLCLNESNPKSDLLQETKDLLDRCLTETRTLSHLLHPPLLDEAGLGSALSWYVDGFAKRSGIQVKLDIPPDLQRLPSGVELATFRVLQESLTNVHRHSGSDTVEIRLTLNDDRVTLEVQDHGKGLGPELLRSFKKTNFLVGVGLAGMRERVKELGGDLTISSDQRGTLISVFIPLVSASQDPSAGMKNLSSETASASS